MPALPMLHIIDSLTFLSGNKYFSKLDLASGCWQVSLNEDSQEYSGNGRC